MNEAQTKTKPAKALLKRIFSRTNKAKVVSAAGQYRFAVQIGFLILCLWIGLEFHLFVKYLESGGTAGSSYRPPGVEGFLPISSLMALFLFILTGELHPAHPAGVFILFAILLLSLIFSKSFCSWLCPFGLVSESLADLGQKITRKKFRMPNFADIPLRSLKYLLLLFFIYAIFVKMDATSLRAFLDSPYNQVADIKMYYFFAKISRLAAGVLAGLVLISIIIPFFWCRYLCPYGALLGIVSIVGGISKIRRNPESCIDCALCTKACPSLIKVDKKKTVVSDECTSCLNCVDVCPVDGALNYEFRPAKRMLTPRFTAIAIIGTFILITGTAMILGLWQNQIKIEDYFYHIKRIDLYDHPR